MKSLEQTEAALRGATTRADKLQADLTDCSSGRLAAESSATLLVCLRFLRAFDLMLLWAPSCLSCWTD